MDEYDHGQRPVSGTPAARLSLASAVETTVVTTTTKKTLAYPPLIINPPPLLKERSPDQYPLAACPTPAALKRVRFQIGNQMAEFREGDESACDPTPHPSSKRSSHPIGGASSSTQHSTGLGRDLQRRIPPSYLDQTSIHKYEHHAGSATPISLPDDADTSGSEARDMGYMRASHKEKVLRRRSDEIRQGMDSTNDEETDNIAFSYLRASEDPPPSMRSATTARSRGARLARETDTRLSGHFNGSTTPPPQDTDEAMSQENVVSASESMAIPRHEAHPSSEVSLPSPSLSPITAAAQMHRSLPASKLRQTEYFGPRPSNLQENSIAVPSQPRTPVSIADIGNMLDTFDAMPNKLQTYVMYQLLRRCSKDTLVVASRAMSPALKVDFMKRLPVELSHFVVQYLDRKSLCRAAQVSKTWRQAIDGDEKAWSDLVLSDGFKLGHADVERAMLEGWGWQSPAHGDGVDSDLSIPNEQEDVGARFRRHATLPPRLEEMLSNFMSRKRKRKESPRQSLERGGESKRRRTEQASLGDIDWPSEWPIEWPIDWAKGFRPKTFAETAAFIVPNPPVGIRGIRHLHLFKSIYRRQFLLARSWLDPMTKPRHVAFKAHEGHVVTCLQFDSEKILTGSDDAIIDIYDTTTGARLKRLAGHEGGVWALEYQDNILVSGSTDRSVRIWDMNTGKCLHVFQGHTSTVRCLQILQPVKTGTTVDGRDIMTPPERLIITGSRDSNCRIWKLPKMGDRGVFQSGTASSDLDNPYFLRALTGHTHSVRAIAAHSDTLASGSYDGTVRIWKVSTGETTHRLAGHSTKVYSVVLDHARQRCISGSMDTIVKVWSTVTGECLFNLSGHQSLVGLLDLRDDILVSAAADYTLKIWDPATGQNRHTLRAHTGAITCFAHDANKVISGSERTLKMWDIRTGRYVKDLLTGLRGVWQVRFDDRRCIAAVHRGESTFIEILDFGAVWDRVPESDCGRRIVVDVFGDEIHDDESNHGLGDTDSIDDLTTTSEDDSDSDSDDTMGG